MVWLAPLRVTVPLLCVNVPPLWAKSPDTESVVEGAVKVPFESVKPPLTVSVFALPA